MLQISQIRSNPGIFIERLNKRNIDAAAAIKGILEKDAQAREKRLEMETLQARGNAIAREVGELMKTGKKPEAEAKKSETAGIKEEQKALEIRVAELEEELFQLIVVLPNAPHASVPEGKEPEDNQAVLTHGELPTIIEGALPHWELAAKYKLIDFELGVKIAGAGFPVYTGKGARLQRALINYFLDRGLAEGYYEIQPPIVINRDSGFGTGQLPDKEGQMYEIQIDELYMIPTAEVPITNLYRDVILKEEDLPIKNMGYTPCFRREAGSYGAHVRGLNRLHQFDKVEIVQIAHPDESYEILEEMQEYVQRLLQSLGLHYRVLLLCGGDMGFGSAKTYDMEVWSGAQQRWLEVSSISNVETFQSHRMKCRFRNAAGKTELVHTLNGSALALPRIVAALLENNQTEKGIRIPEVLQPYTGFALID